MARRPDRHADDADLRRTRPGGWVSRAAVVYGIARLALRLAWAGMRHWPRRKSAAERLAALPSRGLPVAAPVEIRWSDRLVPYIAAASDRDLAVALGLVHAHLRLAQMELLRRVAQGRLAELLGPLAVPLDHGLRVIDPARAVPEILARLPDATREWLDGYVAGVNHALAAGGAPHEFCLLGITPAAWSSADVLSLVRLAGADVTWLLSLRLMRWPRAADWPELWARLIAAGTADFAAGSNAFAVAGRRSAGGQAWLAGDPHLPLSLPSIWLMAAYRSPSYNVAGLTIPGIPAMAIGRNPFVAWGGTNLHAASSDLFDLSGLPPEAIVARRVRLGVRWSGPRDVVLRESPYGPVVSDLPWFGGPGGAPLALRWVGHLPSDELAALLAINRARDMASLRRAAEGLAVPGQTLVFADGDGRVGRAAAAWLPRRNVAPPADLITPAAGAAAWEALATAADLPAEIDPRRGFVVSANDRPPPGGVPIGWFFSPDDRARRIAAELHGCERVGIAELTALLADVASPAALAWRDRLLAELTPPPEDCPVFEALSRWDGRYDAGSSGALAFELVVARLIAAAVPERRRRLLAAAWHGRPLLIAEIDALVPAGRAAMLRGALAAARPEFGRWREWGRAHRLHLAHPLGRVAWIGRRYRCLDWSWPGSNDTVFKSAHGPVDGRHAAGYGSNARYIFDLSDPDANRLVILGGQDGAPGSVAFLDQAELFWRGEYVEVPLRLETARASLPHCTRLEPAGT